MERTSTQELCCVSLGMVILDEIRMPNKPPLINVIGGSATFVTLGLRLFATLTLAPGCLVLAGSDFPPEIREEMQTWKCNPLSVIDIPNRPSSRGLLVYEDDTFGPKTFEYTTPPLRAEPKHLLNTPLLSARAFHFFGRPEEILTQVPELLHYRREAYPSLDRPFIVWEPLPSSCSPENLDAFRQACRLVDVFSPNHLELAALLPTPAPALRRTDEADEAEKDALARLEALGAAFLVSLTPSSSDRGTSNPPTLILRAAAAGSLALHPSHPTVHVPAFFLPGSDKVIDVTGAGNAFLGGYVAGWLREGSVRGAMEYGAIAAGVAIGQIGIPRAEGVDGVGMGLLREFRERVGRV